MPKRVVKVKKQAKKDIEIDPEFDQFQEWLDNSREKLLEKWLNEPRESLPQLLDRIMAKQKSLNG